MFILRTSEWVVTPHRCTSPYFACSAAGTAVVLLHPRINSDDLESSRMKWECFKEHTTRESTCLGEGRVSMIGHRAPLLRLKQPQSAIPFPSPTNRIVKHESKQAEIRLEQEIPASGATNEA